MDDAMILTCGHSYGRGGMQQVYLMVIVTVFFFCYSVYLGIDRYYIYLHRYLQCDMVYNALD